MAYNKNSIDNILKRIAAAVDISDDLFNDANKEYTKLGKWINDQNEYEAVIYPQGSFALGTVIKPISDEDDYDLDLVCELSQDHGFSAEELKVVVVKPWLESFNRIDKIEEKCKCWHVEYSDIPNFHMDVIPSFKKYSYINITNHNEKLDTYEYEGSNPKGYEDWFYERCKGNRTALYEQYCNENKFRFDATEIEKLPRNKYKSSLQQAIQLMKRYRDVMFEGRDDKPISIIITTLAGQLYDNESSIIDATMHILDSMEHYIDANKRNGKFYIENPSYPGENFANKWNDHPERASAFFEWLHSAREFFDIERMAQLDKVTIGKEIKNKFGANTGKRILNEMAEEERILIENKSLKVDTKKGGIFLNGTIVMPTNHHHA